MENYLAKAIRKLKPTAEFSFSDNDYSTVKWDILDGDAPTQKQIDDAILQIKNEEKTKEADDAKAKSNLLKKLGITEEEARLLLS
jgi:hypothetical protein